jgi:hypothetical protein
VDINDTAVKLLECIADILFVTLKVGYVEFVVRNFGGHNSRRSKVDSDVPVKDDYRFAFGNFDCADGIFQAGEIYMSKPTRPAVCGRC